MSIQLKEFTRINSRIMLICGVFFGFLYSFGGLFYDFYYGKGFNYGTVLAFLALIGMPVLFYLIGWLYGHLGFKIYTLIWKNI